MGQRYLAIATDVAHLDPHPNHSINDFKSYGKGFQR
jgi:hypothetical protein